MRAVILLCVLLALVASGVEARQVEAAGNGNVAVDFYVMSKSAPHTTATDLSILFPTITLLTAADPLLAHAPLPPPSPLPAGVPTPRFARLRGTSRSRICCPSSTSA